jgi:hypothetical protein
MRVVSIIKYKMDLLVNIIKNGDRNMADRKLSLVKAVETRTEELLKVGVNSEPIEDISDLLGDVIARNKAVTERLAALRLTKNKDVLRSYRIKN